MARNVSPELIYDFITGDFEDAWESLAANKSAKHRGNFLFARQATTLLEWAARLCAADASGDALQALALALGNIEARYFTVLPGVCADFKEFALPSAVGSMPQQQLLWAIFDLVRNGQAHQYQQITVDLSDGKEFMIQHSGAQPGFSLNMIQAARGQSGHLGCSRDPLGNVLLLVRPDLLFLDVRAAVEAAALLSRNLTFQYLTRPRAKVPSKTTIGGPYYQFDSQALEAALRVGGHTANVYGMA